jgi:hypothetical protein
MDILKTIEEKDFWGYEFLTWLWFLSETSEDGEVITTEDGPVSLWIEEHMVLEGFESPSHENIIKSGDVAGSPEAAAALKVGKKATLARFGMSQGELSWTLVLDGKSFDLRSLKIPAVEPEEDDLDDPSTLIFLRMGMVKRCLDILDELYTRYAKERVSGTWEKDTLPLMSKWIITKSEEA